VVAQASKIPKDIFLTTELRPEKIATLLERMCAVE
jgi:hypothetical protein